jgi:hypothetical protein
MERAARWATLSTVVKKLISGHLGARDHSGPRFSQICSSLLANQLSYLFWYPALFDQFYGTFPSLAVVRS